MVVLLNKLLEEAPFISCSHCRSNEIKHAGASVNVTRLSNSGGNRRKQRARFLNNLLAMLNMSDIGVHPHGPMQTRQCSFYGVMNSAVTLSGRVFADRDGEYWRLRRLLQTSQLCQLSNAIDESSKKCIGLEFVSIPFAGGAHLIEQAGLKAAPRFEWSSMKRVTSNQSWVNIQSGRSYCPWYQTPISLLFANYLQNADTHKTLVEIYQNIDQELVLFSVIRHPFERIANAMLANKNDSQTASAWIQLQLNRYSNGEKQIPVWLFPQSWFVMDAKLNPLLFINADKSLNIHHIKHHFILRYHHLIEDLSSLAQLFGIKLSLSEQDLKGLTADSHDNEAINQAIAQLDEQTKRRIHQAYSYDFKLFEYVESQFSTVE